MIGRLRQRPVPSPFLSAFMMTPQFLQSQRNPKLYKEKEALNIDVRRRRMKMQAHLGFHEGQRDAVVAFLIPNG